MRAVIFWITDLLATMPRPRGNDWLKDEIVSYENYAVDVVVSLLETDEISELEIEKEQFAAKQTATVKSKNDENLILVGNDVFLTIFILLCACGKSEILIFH